MYDYYNNLPDSIMSQDYDFVIGHLTDSTINAFHSKTVDLNKIKTKKIILGHIHPRANERYIGSIFPLNHLQSDTTRAIWVLDNHKWSEIPLPNFLDFYDIEFPSPLPKVPAMSPVWTIYNCKDISLVEKYGNIYIRQVLNKSILDRKKLVDNNFKMSFSQSESLSPYDLLMELIKQSDTNYYGRSAVQILKKVLKSTKEIANATT
jgi:hypothetical protein